MADETKISFLDHGRGYVTNFDWLDSTDKNNEESSFKGRSHWAKPPFSVQDVTETVHVETDSVTGPLMIMMMHGIVKTESVMGLFAFICCFLDQARPPS